MLCWSDVFALLWVLRGAVGAVVAGEARWSGGGGGALRRRSR